MVTFEEFYEKYYRLLFLIPLCLLFASLFFLVVFYAKNGDIMYKDVSLTGGLSATVYVNKEVDIIKVESFLKKEVDDVFVRALFDSEEGSQGILIESSELDSQRLQKLLEGYLSIKLDDKSYFVQETGSRLGDNFYKEMIKALLIAFVLMSIVIFVAFRSFVPSLVVILSAFFDIIVTLALIDLIGMKISSSGIAALILLIGYSVDTDILLTTRVLKRRAESVLVERILSSIKTGLTMAGTTIVATIVGFFLTTSFVLQQMFLIISMGVIVDIFSTYTMNAGILRLYMKRKYHE